LYVVSMYFRIFRKSEFFLIYILKNLHDKSRS
jgi:hypothetical protein